jgi:hypothetical protein
LCQRVDFHAGIILPLPGRGNDSRPPTMKTQKLSRSQLSTRPPNVEITAEYDKKILGLTQTKTMVQCTHDTGGTVPPDHGNHNPLRGNDNDDDN